MRESMDVTLQTDRSEVWAAMSAVVGINRELAPFVRLTRAIGIGSVVRGRAFQRPFTCSGAVQSAVDPRRTQV
jgi:hypothetical protein